MLINDLRVAFRGIAAKPAFASVAIMSLALGIGAATAIFSLWNSVLYASLPGVANPAGLVMLTNPEASGLLRGRWITSIDGPRSWMSYAEFEQWRDHAFTFSAVMATQSSLNTWQVRVDGGSLEAVRGRLVSGEFFNVLQVRPTIGHLFTAEEDAGEPLTAVISHAYWQRRFGGRLDAIGRTLAIQRTAVTIIGVATAGFIGETAGQSPDVWLPLRLQPRLLPGSNWLREQPPDKVMWLRAFGRLRPGVTTLQAEAQANAILRAGLESFYGDVTAERRREFLDQRLQIYPGARGASSTVQQFSASVTALFVAVGVLLLIACANLSNLLLARAAARQGEMAVRVSLGAGRGHLVRQVLTEGMALAALGGVAAMAVASVLHEAVMQLLQEADSWFVVTFAPNVPVLLFTGVATAAAAMAIGAVPALHVTRIDAAAHLQDISRGAIGSKGQRDQGDGW